jgi:hypothetical protein
VVRCHHRDAGWRESNPDSTTSSYIRGSGELMLEIRHEKQPLVQSQYRAPVFVQLRGYI